MDLVQSMGFVFMYLGLIMFTWPTFKEHEITCFALGYLSALGGTCMFLIGAV